MRRAKKIMSSFYGKLLVGKLHEIESVVLPALISDEKAVKRYYKKCTGKDLNLQNPQTFIEKLNWYKLNSSNPLMVECADKVGIRDYASRKGFCENLNEVYGVYERVEDINLNTLPERFVVKAAHGSHMNIIVKDKAALNWKKTSMLLNSWLKQNIYWSGREWVYRDMPHRLIIEKYIEDASGELRDYKFFCFHGEPEYMQYDIGRFKDKQYRNYYDMDRNLLPVSDGLQSLELDHFPIPKNTFEIMRHMARVLSSEFEQVRVDFYCIGNRIIIGEMTFFDGGGSTIFTPDEWNYTFSQKWRINSENKNSISHQ